jgi:very-short-patch-repair endonuclease
LFELNGTLDFPFGTAASMEVDLAARDLRLAIEIDGYYHFQDVEAYRRDRRKDLELQSRGFWVVRVLAEDVVARLEEVLEMIRVAVASRRDQNDGKRGSAP